MGDAEVIPLGTRGRPGRGTGSAKPSAATRNLAGAARPRPARPAPEPEPPQPEAADPSMGEPKAAAPTPAVASPSQPTPPSPPPGPPPGIPVGDWLQAVTAAAVEVFGDRWE